MKDINRRSFLHKSALGVGGAIAATTGIINLSFTPASNAFIDVVSLGETNLKVPRLALGTGSFGWKRTSSQKKLGEDKFVQLAQHAFDRGVKFFETADMYGTHEFVGKAMKKVGRENVTLLSKIMVYDHEGWYKTEPFQKSIDRFRKELNTDYIDILLLHCMVNSKWPDEYKRYMDEYSEAKQKGIIKQVGLSCHDFGAMQVAAESSWADVLLARINHDGAKMDGTPPDIMAVLKRAKENGKGIIGMKIFGCGELTKEDQRQKSLEYVIKSGNVDCMTIGMESIEQVNDNVERIMKLV
ncbi:MAG TPA: aldo/keto reductase [Draconibacterium sp.]|nr:aldo/keto reductase [Draconibacterium sp.]HRX12097.1 aldo/keto reductase [Draconibacterium sp.]